MNKLLFISKMNKNKFNFMGDINLKKNVKALNVPKNAYVISNSYVVKIFFQVNIINYLQDFDVK